MTQKVTRLIGQIVYVSVCLEIEIAGLNVRMSVKRGQVLLNGRRGSLVRTYALSADLGVLSAPSFKECRFYILIVVV
jgi:hypothetical protein